MKNSFLSTHHPSCMVHTNGYWVTRSPYNTTGFCKKMDLSCDKQETEELKLILLADVLGFLECIVSSVI
jgi:hypothetical protein